MSAPTLSDELLGRCHYLRTVGQLPCHINEHGRLALMVGGNVRAIIMTETWGARVKFKLTQFGISGPIMWHPFQRLTFITSGHDPASDRADIGDILRDTDTMLMEPGRMVTLPGPTDDGRGWDTPVRDHFRPAMGSVLAALAACKEQAL